MTRALMLFRRDLRLEDNTALNAALASGADVHLAFLLDERQIGDANAYRSQHAVDFLYDSLLDLSEASDGRLSLLRGIAEKEVPRIAKAHGIEALYFNADYTPFARMRDEALIKEAERLGITTHVFHDALLNAPGTLKTSEGTGFKVFTRFYLAAQKIPVRTPVTGQGTIAPLLPESVSWDGIQRSRANGGRRTGEEILKNLASFSHYKDTRDIPSIPGTTRLSAHLKFGTISVREAYYAMRDALGASHEALTRQLYWRDFFTHIAYDAPKVFGHAFVPRYDRLSWDTDESAFEKWKQGMTGFPIVDAGMREMKETGYMHNRVRMITASFLTKDLHISWLEGERYFATQLADYDPAVNNGNWQWVAGTGADAQPWFRIFNPWLQQKRFDPECVYIRKWIPELSSVPPEDIHAWMKRHEAHTETGYPAPMLDHAEEAKETKRRYGRG